MFGRRRELHRRRRRLRRLADLTGAGFGLAALRKRKLAENEQRYEQAPPPEKP
jgi:hypothetical protein